MKYFWLFCFGPLRDLPWYLRATQNAVPFSIHLGTASCCKEKCVLLLLSCVCLGFFGFGVVFCIPNPQGGVLKLIYKVKMSHDPMVASSAEDRAVVLLAGPLHIAAPDLSSAWRRAVAAAAARFSCS